MRWVALMPLRGGSKSIPDKNIQEFFGRPLYTWSLEAALRSRVFDDIYVSTDSSAFREDVISRYGDQVTVIDRSPEVSSDEASTESVMLEFSERHTYDVLGLIQATSPLTEPNDFIEARSQFEKTGLDSMLTAVRVRRFYWTTEHRPLNYDPHKRPRRQEFDGVLEENGAFYFTTHRTLEKNRNRLGGQIGIYEMTDEHRVELDEPGDWPVVEQLLEARTQALVTANTPSPRALVLDVDGTLTDGGMYYGREGEVMKRFDTRDAQGIAQLRDAGFRIGVITAESSPAVHSRMKKLQIDDYHFGIQDKLPVLQQLAESWQLTLPEVAYVGDDSSDLECLKAVYHSYSPRDATRNVKLVVRTITDACAGRGAVREVCEAILDINNQPGVPLSTVDRYARTTASNN